METTSTWNLRRGRDEVVQDDGDCRLGPKTLQIVSQFANKKESGEDRAGRDRSGAITRIVVKVRSTPGCSLASVKHLSLFIVLFLNNWHRCP